MKPVPLLALALLSCTDKTEDTDDVSSRPERFDAVASALSWDLARSDAPAASIAIYQDGEVVWAEAFGTLAADSDVSPSPTTLFQLGSTTKMFTSVALLQGVQAGDYALDDDILSLLPLLDAPEADVELWSQVTPHTLISHQTGLTDFIEWGEGPESSLAAVSYDDYPAARPFMNPPDLFYNYSNPNFSYAGLIAEVHQGESYPELMASNVFGPLGMTRTFMSRDAVREDGDYALGSGLIIGPNGRTVESDVTSLDQVPHAPASVPAGVSTWTTPTQLLEMADFLIHGNDNVLSDALRAQITTGHAPTLDTPDDVAYGYGIFVRPGFQLTDGYHATPLWEHGGNTLQYSCMFYILPELNYAVAILSSGYGTNFGETMAAALAAAPNLPTPTEEPEYVLDTDRFADHVGYYDGPSNLGDIIIEQREGGLQWTLPLLDSAQYPYEPRLQAVSSTLFFGEIDGQNYDITFIGEPGSPSEYVRNRSFVGIRGEAPVSVARPSGTPSIRPPLLGPGASL